MDKFKALYVGHMLIGDSNATGNTLYNLYAFNKNVDWLQLCLDYNSDFHSSAKQTIYISKIKSMMFYFIKSLYRKCKGGTTNFPLVSHNRNDNVIISVMRAFLDVLPKKISAKSYKVVDKYEADFVYTLADNISTLKMAINISKRYNIPIILHIMDDLEGNIYNAPGTQVFRKKYLRLLNEAYKRTICNFAISEKMATEYEKRHQTPFTHIMNCISCLNQQSKSDSDCIRLIFSGGLHGGRAEMLKKIGKAIKDNEVLNKRVRFDVYTSLAENTKYENFLGDVCQLHEYVPKDKMFENLGKADILVHVESFCQNEIDYFRYSLSTKIPEYLSVGRPIFCLGPLEVCSVSYIYEKQVGLVVNDEAQIPVLLLQLVEDKAMREKMGNNALMVAKNEYLFSSVSERIEKTFLAVIKGWNDRKYEY